MNQDERIERYIMNKMTEEEASEFEAYFLSDQECIEQLEIAEKLHQGMQSLEFKDNDNVVSIRQSKKAWWAIQIPLLPIAAAILVYIFLPTHFLSSKKNAPTSVDVVAIELASLRSNAEDVIMLEHSEKQRLLSIYVDTELSFFDYPEYEFKITNAIGEILFTQEQLQTNSNSTVFINLGTRSFPSDTLNYEFNGIDAKQQSNSLKSGEIIFK